MSGKSLDDEISRAHAREARESRQAGLGPPSYHLGGPPEPWELAIGDTAQRVGRQGRSVVDYAAKMNAMGINEQSLAGDVNPIADHVASVGRNKMRLLPGAPMMSARKVEALTVATDLQETLDKDDAASISGGESSDFSDDDSKDSTLPSEKGAADGDRLVPGYPEDEPLDGMELIEDKDIQNAVEDFDSTNWTMDQLEVSCQTLLEECYTAEDRRRRLLSAGMLRKLIEIYPSALRWMQRNLEAVVNDGLPSMIKGCLGMRVFKLDILLGILAPAMAESLTQLNVMARLMRLMVFRMDTAVRVIKFRYTLPKQLALYRTLPSSISTHKRMTLLMQGSALRARWRNVNADEKNGSLPPSLLHAYLCIILALIDTATCPKLFRMNRVKMVGGGGLLALAVHFKVGNRSQRLACRILRELAREPLLIHELLKAGVTEWFSHLLPRLRETSINKLLEALDALDSMAFSAMRFCVLSSANPDRGQGNSALVAALVEEGSSIGGLESEIKLPTGDKVDDSIRTQLGLPYLVASLAGLLEETDVQLYLAGVVILGKLACTVCYHSVLQEMLAYAGRALERLVQGVQSQEELVPEMSLALFLQLCSRQEGRDGIEASDGAAHLRPLISGCRAQESPAFLRGLTCAVALARRGVPGPATDPASVGANPPSTAGSGLLLPRAGGVGPSGPAKPHPLDLEGTLYNDLVDMLDAPPPAPLEAVQGLVRMGFLEAVMRFLVRDDDEGGDADNESTSLSEVLGGAKEWESRNKGRGKRPRSRVRGPYFFSLKQRHACLGAVALHGLAVLAGPHPAILTGSTLRYLCYAIQVAYIDLTMGRLAPGVGYPLIFQSIQLACRALAFLATTDEAMAPSIDRKKEDGTSVGENGEGEKEGVRQGPLRRVADSLISTTAMNEVACMAQMPSRTAWEGDDGFMYRRLERTVSSAAILIASICPVPSGERDPFSRFDDPQDEQLSLKQCQALMERLVTTFGRPLCSTIMVADNLEILAHTCRALSKLSDANTTIQMLLDAHDLMKAIIRLGPKAPAVLPAATPWAEKTKAKSILPNRPVYAHGNAALIGKREPTGRTGGTGERSKESPPGESLKQNQSFEQRTRSKSGETWVASGDNSKERRETLRWNDELQGGVGRSREREDVNYRFVRLLWTGYNVQEGDVADASTRKLCSLPFDYFRLVANVARVPSGRAVVQSSGILKRCLERLGLNVLGCPAAELATLRCRSEICMLVARMAGTYDRDTGAANDFILCPRYRAVRVMLGMIASSPEDGKLIGGSKMLVEIARHNAACALAELCRDMLKAVPLTAEVGGIHLACSVAEDPSSPMPLLKHVLRVLQAVASFPDGLYTSSMAGPALLRSLHRIANTSYPGLRPKPVGKDVSSACTNKKTREKASNLQQTTDGGKAMTVRKGAAPRSSFSAPKPCSAEAQLISELAREVAYLVGAGRPREATMCLPTGEATSTSQRPAPSSVAKYDTIADARENPLQAADGLRKSADTTKHAPSSAHIDRRSVLQAADADLSKDVDAFKSQGVLTEGNQRPGTYLGCGVTSCGGLGVAGDHGDEVGNVPHPAFVLQQIDNLAAGDVRSGTRNDVATTDGEQEAKDKTDNVTLALVPQDTILATPLALLSERKASFRTELIRRKEHYGLGGTKNRFTVDEETQNSLHIEASAVHDGRTTPPLGSSTKLTKRARSGREGASPVLVDVEQSPLMAYTRPTGLQPLLESWQVPDTERVDHDLTTAPAPTHLEDANQCTWQRRVFNKTTPDSAGKEFVTFARPAAHWSVTASVGGSPGRARSKGVRVPGTANGSVVGRFACRGYLLDPTFAEHNPIILHPRLPGISGGGGGGFSQVPENFTLADLVKSQVAKGVPTGGHRVEPYRNVVEVLRHNVCVSGERKAGKQRFFDEQGRPLSPVNFHHLYDSVEKRRRDHAEPHYTLFP